MGIFLMGDFVIQFVQQVSQFLEIVYFNSSAKASFSVIHSGFFQQFGYIYFGLRTVAYRNYGDIDYHAKKKRGGVINCQLFPYRARSF